MRTRLTLPIALALAVSAVAFSDPVVSPDAAEHCELVRGADTAETEDDVEACRTDVWFHDAGTKVDNVDNAQGTFATWDTAPPATSVTGGAGAGALATSASHQSGTPYDERESFVAAGTIEGVLDSAAVELYLFPPAGMAQGETTYRVDAELEVDGVSLATISDRTVAMETAGSAVQRIRFSFTGLAGLIEQYHGFGLVNALGTSHDVKLTVHGTGIASSGAVYVYDTTEVPAGMVINPPAEVLAEVD